MKNKTTAGLLALFLGGLGIHRFYLGQGVGVVYLLFCWTFIPSAIGFVEAIIFFTEDEKGFNQKYNRATLQETALRQQAAKANQAVRATNWAEQVEKLHDLKEKGIITLEEYEERKRRLG